MAKVLLVEDDGIIALSTISQLLGLGHEVLGVAKSGASACAKIEAHRPDLILMDIVIHGEMSGIDLTRIVNEKYGIPVIYATAHTDQETLSKVRATRHAGVLTKPYEEYQLKGAIDSALAGLVIGPG